MSASKIARRYARALSELCKDTSEYPAVGKQLDDFAQAHKDSDELRLALKNPTIDLDQKRDVVKALATSLGLATMMQNFLLVLLDHGRIGSIEDVADAFQVIVDTAAKLLRATVTSAVSMERADVDRVQAALGRLTGQSVSLESLVDADLIGGARVQIGNLVLDSSIRSHLEKLRERLVQ